jgi:RNA polymerase sigma-54 factor
MLQTQYHALHHLTSAHLAQTMTLLSLTNDELLQQVEAELSTNPALELVESHHCPNCHRLVNKEGLCPYCSLPDISNAEEPIVFVSSRDDFNFSEYTPSEDVPEDNYSTSTDDLPTYVMRQIATELKSEDRPIAAHLLMDLDDDGFITTSLIEVAHYYHVSIDRIKNIIKLIQRADPMGVGSSCPQEALLVQLAMLSETRNVPLLAKVVIEKGMDLLGNNLDASN